MEKLNKKGFTLVELIATIVVLALVVSISAYAITNIINSAKEKNYELLIKNIKDASETYYQECKYSNNSGITCDDTVKLQDLVNYGYLKGNGTKDNKMEIINPKDNKNIGACSIAVKYENGKLTIESMSNNNSCPNDYN
ncbi:MAG: type II secretion system protein [Bacilli bacterium]|nr:type II secretion system protein [Bacilli bacterium]